MVILKMVFLFTISLPELYPVSVLQNFMSALLTGCVTAIPQMIKMSLQLMEKRFGTLMTRVLSFNNNRTKERARNDGQIL